MDVQLNCPTIAGKKDLGQGGYREPKCHSDRFTVFLGCNGELASGARLSAALYKLALHGRVATRTLLLKMTQDLNPESHASMKDGVLFTELTTCNHIVLFFRS